MITVRISSCFPKEKKGLTRSIPVLRLKSQSSCIVSNVPPFCFHDYCAELLCEDVCEDWVRPTKFLNPDSARADGAEQNFGKT